MPTSDPSTVDAMRERITSFTSSITSFFRSCEQPLRSVVQEPNPKTIIELIGTAILVFTIQVSSSALAPVAIGAVLISIIFAGGPVSGAHYNPAISLAVALSGSMPFEEMTAYMIAQVLGGILGSLCGGVVNSSFSVVGVGEDAWFFQALLAEIVFTFILCFVVLSVATSPKVEDNNYYGLAIGLVVMSGAITVGPISGGGEIKIDFTFACIASLC